MILCEICGKKKSEFDIQITKILMVGPANDKNPSQHQPKGKTWRFGICSTCIPFQVVQTVTEVVQVTKDTKKISPIG